MISFQTKQEFDLTYESYDDWGRPVGAKPIVLHYNRYPCRKVAVHRAAQLVESIGIDPGERVLIVGCGFGWLVEELSKTVICLGTETSPYILANKDVSEEQELREAIIAADLDPDTGRGAQALEILLDGGVRTNATILNESSLTPQSRISVLETLGNHVDYVITEDLLPSLTDEEVVELRDALELYGAKSVYHLTALKSLVSPQDANMNWKTVNEWEPLLGSQRLIRSDSFEIF